MLAAYVLPENTQIMNQKVIFAIWINSCLRYTLNTDKESVPVCISCIPGTYSTAPGYCVRGNSPHQIWGKEGLFKARLQASFFNRPTIFLLYYRKIHGCPSFQSWDCVKKAFKSAWFFMTAYPIQSVFFMICRIIWLHLLRSWLVLKCFRCSHMNTTICGVFWPDS